MAILCLHGANTEVTDHEKRTPLIEASYAGDLETVKALYHGHANINATDIRNITSLHYAAIKGHWQVVAFLLQSGINIKVAANLDFKNPRLVEDSPIPSIREFVKRNKAGEFGNEFNKLERLYAKFGFYMAHTENAFMPTIPRKTALYYAVLGGCIKTTLILLEKYVATDFQFFKMEIADVLYYLIDNIEFKNKILSEYSHLFNNKDFCHCYYVERAIMKCGLKAIFTIKFIRKALP
ncbi:MAG: ankyrin repeat domain-containing protein [Coxiellaceae bacterium]|nr:MAG: ankyrin repeat domain-containing protein [Coxiellaceae bacterium]